MKLLLESEIEGQKLTIESGKIARQADGAVLATLGATQVLSTVSVTKKDSELVLDFTPLTVHYREMMFSAGQIPGGFNKREGGRQSDTEVLVSRLIDRATRPLLAGINGYDIQIITTVLSYDGANSPDTLAIIASYAALIRAGLLKQPVAASRVCLVDNKLVVNPSVAQIRKSSLELIIAGDENQLFLIDFAGKEIESSALENAISAAHTSIEPILSLMRELQSHSNPGLAQQAAENEHLADELIRRINKNFKKQIESALGTSDTQKMQTMWDKLIVEVSSKFAEKHSEGSILQALNKIKLAYKKSQLMLQGRSDGRKEDEIRDITCEVDLLARTHGSALFTRGKTQALVITTLGNSGDEQLVETLDGPIRERFLLHYTFPPYAVNETSPLKATSRREIGHGKLAWKAVQPLLPEKEAFPYTISTFSEITESDGSSSMATVCGASMSLMSAGVPIKSPVAGVAMGILTDGEQYKILSDISAEEDFLGEMDFKIAGTRAGFTALQMDVKSKGINQSIIQETLKQATKCLEHILGKMDSTISKANTKVNNNAPVVLLGQISKNKIREVIGAGGKNIREISESTSTKIRIDDEGVVEIFASKQENAQQALDRILSSISAPEVGKIYDAIIVKLIDIGLIVQFDKDKESLLHVNDLGLTSDTLKQNFSSGDVLQVRFIGYDNKKRHKVSLHAAPFKKQATTSDTVVSEIKHFK